MVKPVGLIENVEEQTRSVDSTLKSIKDFAESLNNDNQEAEQAKTEAFYKLVMKRGEE